MYANYISVQTEIIKLIAVHKNIAPAKIIPAKALSQLDIDALDLFELILLAERTYGVTIPDHVPLQRVADLVNYIYTTTNCSEAG